MSFSTKKFSIGIVLTLFVGIAWAQQQTPLDIALRYLEQEHDRWQLNKTDVADVLVSNQYQTRHNGVTHLYFVQRNAGIPVHNAILSVHITADGKVGFANSRFVPNLAEKVNAKAPLITALQAIIYAARQLELPGKASPVFIKQTEQKEVFYEDSTISRRPIKVRLMYQPMEDGTVRLAWDMAIQQTNTPDYWSVRIDALTGNLLDKNNWTVYCNFDADNTNQTAENCTEEPATIGFVETKQALLQRNFSPNGVDNAAYDVFPIPVESPIHGQRQLLLSPADPLASPYGWHDTNGVSGAEYRYTRGNNAHAYLDLNDRDVSSADEPQGGTDLIFDFPFDPKQEPINLRNAAVTQLFYMNNIMHDFSYHYGFDEAAGNFQKNNYGNGGSSEDYVLAQSQDGGGTNNANFSTPDDGINPTMQMYLWSGAQNVLFSVDSPAEIAKNYPIGTASFGLQYSPTPISGKVVEARDSSQQGELVCSAVANKAAVAGNFAMITRGTCNFTEKVKNAQAAGAIGVIICNVENVPVTMGGTDNSLTIPAISLSSSNCVRIKEQLARGDVHVTIQYPTQLVPKQLDASFDNGIVSHEYGHGISTRLTGGPANSDCLNNNEQMGEGWSDFFALVVTAKPGDVGTKARGIGTYVNDRDTSARGIRRYPYSTDMNVNPQTFDDIIGTTSPHSLGEIWADALWDLYWKMVDVYGWDSDLYNGSGGNNKAIQLVIDGMKLQTCNPGFLDGRDAILAADILDNDGANQCLIWDVFARRGLGFSANQASAANRNDGKQAFDIAPECTKKLLISKKATPLIQPGDNITVTLEVANYKDEPVTDVEVSDEIPAGASFINGSTNLPAQVENGAIHFKINTLAAGNSQILTYQLSTSPDHYSIRQFLDDVENGTDNWKLDSLAGADTWRATIQKAFSGRWSWYVPATLRKNDQMLQLAAPILVSGTQPVLRFYHNYDSNPGLDGGIIQISTNGGTTWQNTDSLLFRNGYRGRIANTTFGLSKQQAYWGKSEDFVDSYLDLQPFIGQEILVRFRFGSQAKDGNRANGTGWWVDNVEFFDMYNYQSQACATTKEGDQACALAESRGTIVQPKAALTGTNDPQQPPLHVSLFPNPASKVVNVAITAQQSQTATLRIFSTDGRLLLQQTKDLSAGIQIIPLPIQQLNAGFYLVEIRAADSVITQKMIVK